MRYLSGLVLANLIFIGGCTNIASPSSQTPQNYDWPAYANDPFSSKYAPLDQINKGNIKQLQVAWSWNSVDNALVARRSNIMPLAFKSTPIKVGNKLYISTSLGQVAAIDAITGQQLWVFDTRSWESGRPTNLGYNHRGVSYWKNGDKERIFMPANDAWLWSIDAQTGLPDTTFGEHGKIDLTQGLGRTVERSFYSMISAPSILNNIVIIGSSIWDGPQNKEAAPGHVRGFDTTTGEQIWIFHSIAQPGETGHETWKDNSWQYTGNTNVWSLMSVDPELGYVYLPFGTPTNDWYGGHRPGDNLFGESLVCLDAQTGKLVWFFQAAHHGLWDYDLPAAPNLIDITVDGKAIKAVAQISKQGFVYVLDRVSGKPVWPIEERAVPASSIPGEQASPTQPFPTRPAPFEPQGISEDKLIDFTPALRAEAIEIMNKFEYGELYTPPSLKGTIVLPGWAGGANWSGAAFDPKSALLYIPSRTAPIVVQIVEPDENTSNFRYVRGGTTRLRGPQRLPLIKPPYGRISAINMNTGEYQWVQPNGEGIRSKLIERGIADPGPVGSFSFTGPLLTSTLLFIAVADVEPQLRILDKFTGELIHEIVLPAAPAGTPMTYMANGKQYISLAIGGSRDARLITLALP